MMINSARTAKPRARSKKSPIEAQTNNPMAPGADARVVAPNSPADCGLVFDFDDSELNEDAICRDFVKKTSFNSPTAKDTDFEQLVEELGGSATFDELERAVLGLDSPTSLSSDSPTVARSQSSPLWRCR